MVRGTTPTFTLTVRGDEELDLTRATAVFVTLQQLSNIITLSGNDLEIEPQVVRCYLSQEDSIKLSAGEAKIQINWTYTDSGNTSRRNATKVRSICIEEQLLRKVI